MKSTSNDFSFIKLCHILCSVAMCSLIILLLKFSILNEYKIIFHTFLN